MRLAAAITRRTAAGASSGASARPSGPSTARPGGAAGSIGSVLRLEAWAVTPPGAAQAFAPGIRAMSAVANRARRAQTAARRAASRAVDNLVLLRRPAGLADGLALKESCAPPEGG